MTGTPRPDSKARLALIFAAERHFALNGFGGVPLKAIHAAAGHKNASATQYHFGSREGLIKAILDHRMPALNQRRHNRLASLQQGGDPNVRELVTIWIEPLADELKPRPDGNYYLRFLEHLRREASSRAAKRVMELQAGYIEFFKVISGKLNHLPLPIRRSRIAIAAEQIISSLAALESAMPARKKPATFPSFAVNNLIDYVTGGLLADVSPTTRELNAKTQSVDFQLHFLEQDVM
jgi:AcrR family transcriptional regulator